MSEQREQGQSVTFDLLNGEQKHFHNEACIRLLYFTSGSTVVACNDTQKTYTAGGMLVTGPLEWYFCNAISGSFIMLTMQLSFLAKIGIEQCGKLRCDVQDNYPGIQQSLDRVRTALANLWQTCFAAPSQLDTELAVRARELFLLLRQHFSDDMDKDLFCIDVNSPEYRRSRILGYIHAHWAEELKVAEIAAGEYITPNYLSRFWQEQMRCTLTDYISEVRLDHVEKQLRGSKSIKDIAADCGFLNTNTLNRKFFARFGMLPKQYRDNIRTREQKFPDGIQNGRFDLMALLSYADTPQNDKGAQLPRRVNIQVRRDAAGTPLRHTWRRLVNIGYAKDGLVDEVKKQLLRAQREVGFEYIRFHGIFDDDMHIYYESPDGEVQPNYLFVDMLLDFLVSIGGKPFIEFGYTPRALASQPIRVLERETYFSNVNDYDKWSFLIRHFLRHAMERFGEEKVLQWRFSVAGSELKLQGYISAKDYLAHYKASFRAVKSVNAALKFGGFNGHSSLIRETDEFEQFLRYCVQEKCVPDFICIQNFPIQRVVVGGSANPVLLQKISPVTISPDVHYSRELLAHTREILEKYCFADKEIWFEEWNSSIWQRDIAHDTCYKAAWLIKDVCENYDEAEAFGYWLLTDLIEERLPQSSFMHFGGCGLFTYCGVPKAGWNAMRLLQKLGDECIASGDGYYVTRKGGTIQILLYQYAHYGDMYRFCNQSPIGSDRAYDVFLSKAGCKYQIAIKGSCGVRSRIKKYTVDRKNGSSFDKWLEMGKPRSLHPDEIAYLERASDAGLSIREWDGSEDIQLETTLQVHECQLYEVTFLP